MAIDDRLITSVDLNPYLVDKNTGAPLSGGSVEFRQDDDRSVPKLVYQLSGSPPNYTYTALPNPVTLSSVGTFQNGQDDNVALYYFPYEGEPGDGVADAQEQLYYVVVKDSNDEVQFTREAWPNRIAANVSPSEGNNNFVNRISNPQFAIVLFDPTQTLTISYTGASTTTTQIAPDWYLEVVHTNSGSLTVARTSIAGNARLPYNAPYTLTITPGSNISRLRLYQRLLHNPDIWAPTEVDVGGYVNGSIMLGNGTSLSMIYAPSVGTEQEIFSANNNTGDEAQFGGTVQLELGANTDTSDDGYVDIILSLSTSSASTISNVQIVNLDENITDIPYDQNTVNDEEDTLFSYYNPLLQYKPVSSYLVGWDFPLNPAQWGATQAASAIGANKSKYVWDQTIIFQSANSGVGVTRANSGALVTTAAATTQMALIQYLDAAEAREILSKPCSVTVSAKTSVADGVTATVSLWYTTDASLPVATAGTNNSIVLTLDANGKPATRNGTWTEVTRGNLGDAKFTIEANATQNFNDYGFSGWNNEDIAGASTATFFAIVVGTASVATPETISWQSISLVPGKIPTIPAPQSITQVLNDCRRYYEQSYEVGMTPGAVTFEGIGRLPINGIITGGNTEAHLTALELEYLVTKRVNPTISIYNPTTGASDSAIVEVYKNGPAAGASGNITFSTSFTSQTNTTDNSYWVAAIATTAVVSYADTTIGNYAFMSYHYVIDARLGIV